MSSFTNREVDHLISSRLSTAGRATRAHVRVSWRSHARPAASHLKKASCRDYLCWRKSSISACGDARDGRITMQQRYDCQHRLIQPKNQVHLSHRGLYIHPLVGRGSSARHIIRAGRLRGRDVRLGHRVLRSGPGADGYHSRPSGSISHCPHSFFTSSAGLPHSCLPCRSMIRGPDAGPVRQQQQPKARRAGRVQRAEAGREKRKNLLLGRQTQRPDVAIGRRHQGFGGVRRSGTTVPQHSISVVIRGNPRSGMWRRSTAGPY
jgi:hypothetical protein